VFGQWTRRTAGLLLSLLLLLLTLLLLLLLILLLLQVRNGAPEEIRTPDPQIRSLILSNSPTFLGFP
jgi:hypothetical protein